MRNQASINYYYSIFVISLVLYHRLIPIQLFLNFEFFIVVVCLHHIYGMCNIFIIRIEDKVFIW